MGIKYLSLFSGIGGFELGIEQAYENNLHRKSLEGSIRNGVRPKGNMPNTICKGNRQDRRERPDCIGYSEIDKYAIQIFEKHYPNIKNYGDITTINPKELPDFDLIVGGFPCQSFSIAGKRGGFSDTRGTLFFDIARIIREKQPRLLLLENVKGLLSHDKGRTFYTIISTLDELGYDLQWQVLNSKNFGVPQNRERVFIVGHLRGTPRPEVFPIEGGNPKNLNQIISGGQGNRVYDIDGVSTTLASQAGGQGAKTGLYTIGKDLNDMVSYSNGKESKLDDGTLEGEKKLRKENGDMFDVQGREKDGHTPQKRRLARQQSGESKRDVSELPLSSTQSNKDMQTQKLSGKKEKVRILREAQPEVQEVGQSTKDKKQPALQGARIRRLTPLEAERLQGFPDGWTEGLSDTQRYKTLGNAVTVNVVEEIAKLLVSC